MKSFFMIVLVSLVATPSFAEFWGCEVSVNDVTSETSEMFHRENIAVDVEYKAPHLKGINVFEDIFLDLSLDVSEDEIAAEVTLYTDDQENSWEVVYEVEAVAKDSASIDANLKRVTLPNGTVIQVLFGCSK